MSSLSAFNLLQDILDLCDLSHITRGKVIGNSEIAVYRLSVGSNKFSDSDNPQNERHTDAARNTRFFQTVDDAKVSSQSTNDFNKRGFIFRIADFPARLVENFCKYPHLKLKTDAFARFFDSGTLVAISAAMFLHQERHTIFFYKYIRSKQYGKI